MPDQSVPRPRLLFISRKWPPAIGGMENYSVELAACLSQRFEVVRLVLPGHDDGTPPGLLLYGSFLLRVLWYCLRHARQFEYVIFGDLVLFPAAWLCKLLTSHQKRLVVVYGLDLVYHKRTGLLPRLYRGYLSAFRRNQGIFSGIVAISNSTAQLARQVGLIEVKVILPTVPDGPLVQAGSRKLPLPPEFRRGRRYIFQFGRVIPRKGASWFASQVLPALPDDVSFLVAGSATDSAEVERLRSCPRTRYLGPLPAESIAAMIQHANVVVMPNVIVPDKQDIEGFGLVAVETATVGGLLLASRLQGIADAVIDGVSGKLIEPGNVAAWVAAIHDTLALSPKAQEQFRASARQAALHSFSHKRMLRDVLALLDLKYVGKI